MYFNWSSLLSPNDGKEKFVEFPLDCARETKPRTGNRKAKTQSSSLAPTMIIIRRKLEATIEEINNWVFFTNHDWCSPPSIQSQKTEAPVNLQIISSIWISSNRLIPNRNLPLANKEQWMRQREKAWSQPQSQSLRVCFTWISMSKAHGFSKSCVINK